MIIGLVSDTHGLVRPEIFGALAGVQCILHAGDVGGADVLIQLRAIAPVQAVFGNIDAPDEPGLADVISTTLDGLSVHVSHGHELGSPTPEKLLARYKADVIVFGHTHEPLVERACGRLVVNPGAAGPRRFKARPSIARLTIVGGRPDVEMVWL